MQGKGTSSAQPRPAEHSEEPDEEQDEGGRGPTRGEERPEEDSESDDSRPGEYRAGCRSMRMPFALTIASLPFLATCKA